MARGTHRLSEPNSALDELALLVLDGDEDDMTIAQGLDGCGTTSRRSSVRVTKPIVMYIPAVGVRDFHPDLGRPRVRIDARVDVAHPT